VSWQPSRWQPPVGAGQNPISDFWNWTEPTRTGLLHAVRGDEPQVPAPWQDPAEEERKRQEMQRSYGFDPLRRAQEFGEQVRREPASALLGLAGEAFHTPTSYGLGVVQGLVQSGLERGIGGRSLAGPARDPITGEQHDVPTTRNIFDPAEARARYAALTPGPVQVVEDLLTSTGLSAPGLAARGVKAGLSAAGREMFPLGGRMAEVASSPAAGAALSGLQALTSRPAAALVGAEAAREAWQHTPEDQPLPLRAGESALAALGGYGLTRWVSSALRTQSFAARMTGEKPPAPLEGLSPEAQAYRDTNAPEYAARRGVQAPRTYGGGSLQYATDWLRYNATDRWSSLETRQNMLTTAINGPIPEEMAAHDWARVSAGATRAGVTWTEENVLRPWQKLDLPTERNDDLMMILKARMQQHMGREEPVLLDPKFAGPNGKPDPALAGRIGDEFGAALQRQFPGRPNLPQQIDATLGEISQHFTNDLLPQMVDAGFLKPEAVQEMQQNYPQFFAALRHWTDHAEVVGEASARTALSTPTSGIGYLRDQGSAAVMTVEDMLTRAPKMFGLMAKNKAMRAADGMFLGADVQGQRIPGLIDRGLSGVDEWRPVGEQARVPKGYGKVTFWDQGEQQYRLTDSLTAQAMNHMGAAEIPNWLKAVAAMTEPFRAGITMFSMSFLPGHLARSVETAMERAPGDASLGTQLRMANKVRLGLMDAVAYRGEDFIAQNPSPHWTDFFQRSRNAVAGAVAQLAQRAGGDPDVLREAYRAGGGWASISESLLGEHDLLGIPGPPGRALGQAPVFGGIIRGFDDLMRSMTFIADQGPRAAIWRATEGAPTLKRAVAFRDASIDFQKGGDLVRVLNTFVPLLNAREQGWLTSFQAAWENPQRTANRAALLIGTPTIGLYAYNRAQYGDLYDKIPVEDRDRFFNLIVGRHIDSEGRETPLRLRIAKSPPVQLVASPLEHFLDATYHVKQGQQEIDPIHRTPRSAAEMWLSRLALSLPWEPRTDEMASPLGHGMAALTMLPGPGVVAEMYANKSHFTGRPIVPEDERVLPAAYQSAPSTTKTAQALAQSPVGRALGWTPAGTDYLVQGWGGMNAQMWMYMGDKVIGALQDAGLVAPDAFAPKSPEDLGLSPNSPPSEVWKRSMVMPRPDPRPWWQTFVPRVFSWSGGGDTIAQRVEHMGAHEQEVWHQTREMNQAYSERRVALMADLQRLYTDGGKLTHAELRKREGDIYGQMHDAWETIHEQHPLALVTSQDRQAFMAQVPGFTAEAFVQQLPALPPGLTREQLAQRWFAPGGQDIAQLNPMQKAQAQGQELGRISRETGLPTNIIKDYVGAAALERDLPGLPIPALDLERAINEYRAPRDKDGHPLDPLTTPPTAWAQAKRDTLTRLALEYRVPEPQLAQWVSNRHTVPAETNPLIQSRVRAEGLANDLHDPQVAPRFATRGGQPVGNPDEWDQMEAALTTEKQRLQQRKVPRSAWPAQVRQMDDALHYGEVARVRALAADPRAADYERWYGMGRDLPLESWERYQAGQAPKYRTGTPQDWLNWDLAARLYRALPADSPQKRALKPQYEQIRKRATPGWRSAMKLDESES
jgi:hypothetical protein